MSRRKPDFLKLISATARPDRQAPPSPCLPLCDGLPPAPAWLTDLHARSEWQRLGQVLQANKLLNAGNIGALAQLCALHGCLIAAWQTTSPPSAAMLSAYRKALADLTVGVAIAAPSKKPNRFLDNQLLRHRP